MHNNPQESAHKLSRSLHHRLSHFVASIGFTASIIMVGLLGTWLVRSVLTETRHANLTGRVAGASVDRNTLPQDVRDTGPLVSIAIEEFVVIPNAQAMQ